MRASERTIGTEEPALRMDVVSAQSKSVVYESEADEAAPAEGPVIVPGLGAVDGTVKTNGSRAAAVAGCVVDALLVGR